MFELGRVGRPDWGVVTPPTRAGDPSPLSRAEVRAAAESWAEIDPDPETRATLRTLLADDDVAALRGLFGGRLRFGTAGLRAEMGPGPCRMNRVVVRAVTAGLVGALPDHPTVVVGFDARRKSRTFAADVAAVVAAAGGRALLFDRFVPTPVLSFAVGHLHAHAGVMCTASHNPKDDNGYKVFGADGAQIVAPDDESLASAIDDRWKDARDLIGSIDVDDGHERSPEIELVGDDVVDAYVEQTTAGPSAPGLASLSVVYTPLHGVGGELFERVLRRAGRRTPAGRGRAGAARPRVPDRAVPQPGGARRDRPRRRPGPLGPRRPGAGQRSRRGSTGRRGAVSSHWRVAVPDRRPDRCAPCRPSPAPQRRRRSDGRQQLRVVAAPAGDGGAPRCAPRGAATGVRWIARAGADRPERRFVFGYEESLGYLVGERVRDKDGIAAGLAFAELVAGLASSGRTVADRWQELAEQFGRHESRATSMRFGSRHEADQVAEGLLVALRSAPPVALADRPFLRMVDYRLAGPRLPVGRCRGA